jgi:hypothetical protein
MSRFGGNVEERRRERAKAFPWQRKNKEGI